MQDTLYELTGIRFQLEEEQTPVTQENTGGDTPDTAKAFYSSGTQTDFYSTGFSFAYKGAVISGRLPYVHAGYASRLDGQTFDLLPAVHKVCGFPIDMREVGGL